MAKERIRWWRADDVKAIADELVPQYHQHLANQVVLYVFRSKASESNGVVELGKAKRVTGLNAYLAYREFLDEEGIEDVAPASFFLIEIAHDWWPKLEPWQRVALVDHGLCHCSPEETIRAHDVEEFREVIERHGLWRPVLKAFAESAAEALADEVQQQILFNTPKDVTVEIDPKSLAAAVSSRPLAERLATAIDGTRIIGRDSGTIGTVTRVRRNDDATTDDLH